MKNQYSDSDLIKCIDSSISLAETLRKLNLKINGNNYKLLNQRIKNANINIRHFKGNRHGTSNFQIIDLKNILIENSTYLNTVNLKNRLLKENFLDYECYICRLKEWLNKPITLQLDHINGINYDNRLENLRLLCPNCHSQTGTYCRGIKIKKINHCLDCNSKIRLESIRCFDCNKQKPKKRIEWRDIEFLKQRLLIISKSELAKELNVSKSALKNYLNKFK